MLGQGIVCSPSLLLGQVRLGFPFSFLSCPNPPMEGTASPVPWLLLSLVLLLTELVKSMRGGRVYGPPWSHSSLCCPGSRWPHVQIPLQGFNMGGSVCSSGPPGPVVSGLAPLLGDCVLWVFIGILGFLQT